MQSTIQKGDFVRVSDGTPKPPAHHKRKVTRWEGSNFTGWVHRIETGSCYRIGIDKTGTGVMIHMLNPDRYTITKEDPPAEAPKSQLHPRLREKNIDQERPQYKMHSSPWGNVDGWTPFGDLGLYQHSTSSHGGIYVPDEMLAMMPEPYRKANHYGGKNWFEEDCEWALVALSFPSGHSEKQMDSAIRTVKNWYPHQFMAVTGIKLTTEDSSELLMEAERERAKGKYVANCAWGHGNNTTHNRIDVPEGMVGVAASIGGRDENGRTDESTLRYFLIPDEEYQTRSRFGFILEKEYHDWPHESKAQAPAINNQAAQMAMAMLDF